MPNVQEMAEMVAGYVDAALWADCMHLDDEWEESGGLGHLSLSANDYRAAGQHCRAFYDANRAACDTYLDTVVCGHGAWEMLGHDLRMTEGGHGTGFWDREGVPDDIGAALSATVGHPPECWQVDEHTATFDWNSALKLSKE